MIKQLIIISSIAIGASVQMSAQSITTTTTTTTENSKTKGGVSALDVPALDTPLTIQSGQTGSSTGTIMNSSSSGSNTPPETNTGAGTIVVPNTTPQKKN